ncbi:switch 2 isoform X2 [Solanum pennellii]|uniref:Switch 2 isoform X2 n=1 Tax=Solanum pennellii TaxID=28526 RepID=A0ABM1VEL6_SOLPN|nr:switch 2 isoform X2 [Solanum pennellii]
MSLNTFKETLKPCTNQSFSQSSSTSYNFETKSVNPRKPPKSSLSQQLLRLEDHTSLIQNKPQTPKKQNHFDLKRKYEKTEEEEVEEEEEEEKGIGVGKPKLDPLLLDQAGPYEPLVLSSLEGKPPVQVPASINCRLLEHQREGVKFLYSLYQNNHGGVLGDDMGLGKTIQSIAFLAAVYGKDGDLPESSVSKERQRTMGPVLIVCPSSLINNWENEFSKWATFSVCIYHGPNRDLMIDKLEARGVEILITSFDTYRIHGRILSDIEWEIVIIDEAHRLKNEKSKLYEACLAIKTPKRYGLTGTIMQNRLMELFNLFDWVIPGCLGTRDHFREFYEEPLKHGQRSSAPDRFVRVAGERKQHLVSVLRKYLLRRTKEETIGHLMLGKEDNVVFCAMSELQKRVYQRMLLLPDVQCLINKDVPCSCGSPLKQVECCRRTASDGVIWPYLHRDNPDGCDHCPFCLVLPCLVKLQQISNHLELIKPNPRDDPDKQRRDAEFAAAVFGEDVDLVGGNTQNKSFLGLSNVEHCGKMRALEKLMSSWVSQSDKILLFSYSVRMLDILEKFIIRKGYGFSRLDGSTPTGLRQSLVDDFNSSPSKQAQDRSFRFGQKRHVIVFRLLAAGSLEELVYTRQVYKQQLSNIAVSGNMEKRYFEGVQDSKEFQGELFGICNLFRDLSDKLFTSNIIELHEKNRKKDDGTHSKEDFNVRGMYFVPEKEITTASFEGAESSKRKEEECTAVAPALEDLGIVYAHRYEDIVNLGPAKIKEKKEQTMHLDYPPRQPKASTAGKKKLDTITGKKNAGTVNPITIRKKNQYSLLARSMGMEEVQFSKWLLSATPAEREKVLKDYRKRKEKIPNG